MKNEQDATTTKNGHSRRTTTKRSGIEVIDRVYDLEKDGPAFGQGHYIADIWHHVFLDERLRPHHLAMLVFGEIWFRHRPIEHRQITDNGDTVITLTKSFSGDRYQFNRAELAFRLNTSADAISSALTYMEKLGVIKREHEDKDFNHRGFRNVVYVTPVVDKLLALVSETQEKVNKNHPKSEIEGNAHNSDRRDVGNVTPIIPVTLPTSRGPRCPDDPGNMAPVMPVVSKRSSEKSSTSAIPAAEPQEHLEANNNIENSSAPQGAQAGDGAVQVKDWEAPPPNPSGKDGRFGSLNEKVTFVRHQIGGPISPGMGANRNCRLRILNASSLLPLRN